MKVIATHNEAVYVAVEKFEDMLAEFTCSPSKHDNTPTLIFTFDTSQSIALAHNAWADHTELLFVTHHVTCNVFHERAVYKYELHRSKHLTSSS
jgi:hypothetical protein